MSGASTSIGTPVCFLNSAASQRTAAASPKSSKMLGRRSVTILRVAATADSTSLTIAARFERRHEVRSVVGRDEIDERGRIGSDSGFGQAGKRLAAVAHICERKPVVRIPSELKHHARDVGRHAFVALLAFPERALHRTAGAVGVARAEVTGEAALHVVVRPPDAN